MVWRYVNPVTDSGPLYQGDTVPDDPHRPGQKMNAVFKTARYAPDYPGLAGRNLTPQGPIERYHQSVEEGGTPGKPAPRLIGRCSGTLSFAGLPPRGSICVYTTLGTLLGRYPYASSDGRYSLSVAGGAGPDLGSGVYFCQVASDDGRVLLRAKFTAAR
jgi:hypothetical protein